jgi:hypothetical protein
MRPMTIKEKAAKQFDGCGTLIGGLIFLWLCWLALSYLLPEWRIKYALRYQTPYDHVTIQDQPTSCDFLRAPIGEKGCHFEKVISTARWAKSATGTAIVSNDDGKTWRFADPPPNTRIPTTFIWVEWNKVEEP